MGVCCCKAEDKEEQTMSECVNEYEAKTCKTRPPCMVINVRVPVIPVGSVFLNTFYINIKSFVCIIYAFSQCFLIPQQILCPKARSIYTAFTKSFFSMSGSMICLSGFILMHGVVRKPAITK